MLGRRASIRKVVDDDELELVPLAKEILAEPVAGEHELLEAVRKAGGDESVEAMASMIVRALGALRDAYAGRLPVDVEKAFGTVAGGGVADYDQRNADWNVTDARAAIEAEDEPNDTDTNDDEQEDEMTSKSAATFVAELSKEDRASLLATIQGASPERVVKQAADQLQTAEPSLTRAQALVKAYQDDPALYERERAGSVERFEKAEREREERFSDARAERDLVRVQKASAELVARGLSPVEAARRVAIGDV